MSYHFGGHVDVGPLWLELMPTPTTATLFPIPPQLDDENHLKGFSLEPRGAASGFGCRATWTLSTGELARLLQAR